MALHAWSIIFASFTIQVYSKALLLLYMCLSTFVHALKMTLMTFQVPMQLVS